jgi:hypothetical protein
MIEYIGSPLSVAPARLRELEQSLTPVKSNNLAGPGAETAVRELLVEIGQEW